MMIWGFEHFLSLLQVMNFLQCANSHLIHKYNHINGEATVNNPHLKITTKMS